MPSAAAYWFLQLFASTSGLLLPLAATASLLSSIAISTTCVLLPFVYFYHLFLPKAGLLLVLACSYRLLAVNACLLLTGLLLKPSSQYDARPCIAYGTEVAQYCVWFYAYSCGIRLKVRDPPQQEAGVLPVRNLCCGRPMRMLMPHAFFGLANC